MPKLKPKPHPKAVAVMQGMFGVAKRKPEEDEEIEEPQTETLAERLTRRFKAIKQAQQGDRSE